MLILVAGVTGYLGKHLATVGLEKGHKIRGFGRSPNKLPAELLGKLESFVQCESYDDKEALDKAVSGAQGVICCYTSHADAVLEAQISLLRAVERAGIKVYHAHSWNADWTKIRHGDFEHYDSYIAFRRHAELTSPIKPVYVFTGLVGEFALDSHMGIAHIDDDADETLLKYWGDGSAKWDFTYFEDAARFSIDLVTTNKSVLAGEGGFFNVRSAEASAKDIAVAYEMRTGVKVKPVSLGGIEELQVLLKNARTTTDPRAYFTFAPYYSQLANTLGTWKLDDPKEVGAPDAIERLFDNQIEIPKTYT
ncbi:Ff.00g011110.m01.CDS01 [Fusarium sp. VM40]|nr:Ff.00g011110.m01.CDS01 [Fusarium sp. VM40]